MSQPSTVFEIKESDSQHLCEDVCCSRLAVWWCYASEDKYHLCNECKERYRVTGTLRLKKKSGKEHDEDLARRLQEAA